MAVEPSEEGCFDGDFEFDAPQWIDLEGERDQLENESNSDQYDWWFQKVHPLHSPDISTPEPKPKKRPLQKSTLGYEGSKLSSLTSKSSLPGRTTVTGKSSLSNPKRDSESLTSKGNSIGETSSNQGDDIVKKPRKCWQLNGHSSLSFSPQCLSSLPKDLQPKRSSSNSLSNKNSSSALPTRGSTGLVASPLTAVSPSKKLGVKNKNLQTARRSCPQKLQKSRPAWNESSTKSNNDDVDEELQMIIEQHNRKILSQQSEYDLNGRRIKKTVSPVKPAKKENTKPSAASNVNQSVEIDDELRELINKHNRRIWTAQAQNSEYDLNGRRVRKGNTTVVAPTTKTKPDSVQTTPTRAKDLRRSHQINQKRKNPATSKSSEVKLNKTVVASSQNAETSTDFENEIQEIINLHNSRLAAKKAKK